MTENNTQNLIYYARQIISMLKDKKSYHSPCLVIGTAKFKYIFMYILHILGNQKNTNILYLYDKQQINHYLKTEFIKSDYKLMSELFSESFANLTDFYDDVQSSLKELSNDATFTKHEINFIDYSSEFNIREYGSKNTSLYLATSKTLEILKNIKSKNLTIFFIDNMHSKDKAAISRCGLKIHESVYTRNDMINIVKNIFMEMLCEYIDSEYINGMNFIEIFEFVCYNLSSYFDINIIKNKLSNIIALIKYYKGVINVKNLEQYC